MRDREGNPIPNAHLSVLFNRICKLLYYRIKPVFVFDGAAPTIKKIALNQRKERRDENLERKDKISKKLLENLLKQYAIAAVSRSEPGNSVEMSSSALNTSVEHDIFRLNEQSNSMEPTEESDDDSDNNQLMEYVRKLRYLNIFHFAHFLFFHLIFF